MAYRFLHESDGDSGATMAVTHCVCRNTSFEELKLLADRDQLSYDQLRDHTGCGASCCICEPYIRLMLKTGRTRFRVLSTLDITRILSEAARETRAASGDPA